MVARYSLIPALLALAAAVNVAAAENPQTFLLGQDRFAGGRQVVLAQPTTGDAIVAGGDVRLQAAVAGDVLAAGRTVHIGSTAQQDAYAAGSEVTVAGAVRRNARLAGGAVTLAPSGSIEGNVSVAARELDIAGAIGGYLQAAGSRIYINGPVRGDVQVSGNAISLGPRADIQGALRYRSDNDLQRDPAARVAGGVERLTAQDNAEGAGALVLATLIPLLGFAILAAALIIALPGYTQRSSRTATARWGQSLLIGLAALVFVPLLIVAAVISVVGIPLAVALLLLYLLMLLLGFVSAGIAVGDTALKAAPGRRDRTGWRTLAAGAGVAVLLLLTWIPVVGWIVALVAIRLGVGAMLTQLRARNATPEASPAL